MAKYILGLLVVIFYVAVALARIKAPLLDDDGHRTVNKAAECIFGKQVRELGSQWIPDLGVPIGVLYCMRCECVPFQRKRRVVARVQCRSIKNECPEPTCDEPVIQDGHCCKTCPGGPRAPDVIQDVVQSDVDDSEKGSKHFAALLTGRSSLVIKSDYQSPGNNDLNKTNVVASGRFTFHRKNLHFSFYVSDKAARPRFLHFMDPDGNILEEFLLSESGGFVDSVYQNNTRKVCGVWKRVPRDYRRLLKSERLYVALIWGIKDKSEFTLSGQLMKYVSLSTEIFSSLLEPAPGSNSLALAGAGGTAMVSISTSVTPSIHIAVIFNGIFTEDEIIEVPINVTLSLEEKKIILEERVKVHKPGQDLNMIEFSSPMNSSDLRLLTRGRLLLSVASVSQPTALRLSGNVISKITCELFQSSLSSSPMDYNNPYGTSGIAWFYLSNTGSLIYNVQIDNLGPEQMPAYITLMDTKRKSEVEDLTPYFINGWANGTVDKLSPKVLEPLYSGNLAVNVATQKDNNLIRGKLVAKPVGDARDSPAPILLKRENYTLPSSAVGLAWLSVDNDCRLHFDVTVSGLGGAERRMELYIELLPMLVPGAPVLSRHLDSFRGNQVENNTVESLGKEELKRLQTGVGFLRVKEKDSRITLLSATVSNMRVPPKCKASCNADNNVPTLIFDDPEQVQTGNCFHEGQFYEEGAQWTSPSNPCTMCFCQNGVAKCDTMLCPEVACPVQNQIRVPGECCPICLPNSTNSDPNHKQTMHKCIFGGNSYSPGSKFHPFLVPTGFDSCTECICDPIFLEIKCKRQPDERLCCKNCPKPDTSYQNDPTDHPIIHNMAPKKEGPTRSAEQILREGGCRNLKTFEQPYENGSEFHPYIMSLGEYKCVTCKCVNGKHSCKRQPCDKTACEKFRLLRRKNQSNSSPTTVQAIQNISADVCCSPRDCRKHRSRKNHRTSNRTR